MNATQAAIRAGYSAKTAEQQGSRLLRNVQVAAVLSEATAARMKALEITVERLDREAGLLATSDIRKMIQDGEFLRLDEIPDDLAPAIASIEVVLKRVGTTDVFEKIAKVRLWDKNTALKTLYQRHGNLTDNVNVMGGLAIDTTARTKKLERLSREEQIELDDLHVKLGLIAPRQITDGRVVAVTEANAEDVKDPTR